LVAVVQVVVESVVVVVQVNLSKLQERD